MSASFVNLGPGAKVRINGQTFAVTDGSVRVTADTPEVTDSESAPYKAVRTGGLRQMEVDLTFHLATDVAPHTGALAIVPGSSVDIDVYHKGLGYEPYACDTLVVSRFEAPFRVQGSEPIAGRISGLSSGAFSVPTN